ncbi:DUF202 domain-containing protein [Paeniglutamicibacter sulfureus]|uniref:Uncharacterized membrane protein YidH (DUF202 family) n=1 Tax=Paeniglutamicibacter sulfureus TaxID=43666 RepID=A0ABU2BL63_9MICC|nr:DUF202 domain-containing protein [Paeniglutamicibacter sulfureus]MDO2935058.1 DUF202 domain-containing protein [Paeniglutamicibacter sulfureus]MDR7359370.1 uncharacterized membrane protein YidH (DUF202 family) [Paeniglutamicibacter sulfureus]
MSTAPRPPLHLDPGLQPERTVMSWGRTTLSLCVAALVFLRWLPHYGVGILAMIVLALLAAGSIYATQRHRYTVASHGIKSERLRADVVAILAMSIAVLSLGVVGILVVVDF